ncbi:Rieske 2Fe-2S domain-containing protein [Rhizobium sp. RU35A]|uniref:Rieske 2Fe-2S domain-containing protein n=1 Tax=Rhizobium sp. RU35A TaxID=1907414 RepID=UPI00122D3AC1|nr:Rieske 2Fe-2S domain-containing protein [Rhizobium sp. RU35A]
MPSTDAAPLTPLALSEDLPPATVMPIWTPEGPMALWRSAGGTLSLAADRCPHRGMRLSHGFVRGEALSCIYHGWSYDQGGRCLRIPAHPDLEPPASIRVATGSVLEAGGVIWRARADDPSLPPDFPGFVPLRSLSFAVSRDVISRTLGGESAGPGILKGTLAGSAVILLCAEQAEGTSLIHLLAPADATLDQRIAVSRAAETLRRAAETGTTEAAA